MVKNFIISSFLIIPIILYIGCDSEKKKLKIDIEDKFIQINIDNEDFLKPLNYSDVFSEVMVIPLETKKECLLGGDLFQIEIANDSIFILDPSISNTFFLFNKEGKFLKKIGSRGKGPGEYIAPQHFYVDQITEQIYLFDAMTNNIIVYNKNGKYIENLRFSTDLEKIARITDFAIEKDFIYIDATPWPNKVLPNYLLRLVDSKGLLQNEWLSTPEYNKGLQMNFSYGRLFFQTNNDIKFILPFCDTIFSLKNKNIDPFIVLTTKDKINKGDYSDLMKKNENENDMSFVRELHKSCKLWNINNYFENDNISFFSFYKGGNPFFLFYNKNTGKTKCVKFILFNNDIFGLNHYKFCGITSTHLVTIFDPSKISSLPYKKSLEELKSYYKKSKFVTNKNDSILNTIDEQSNPVVLLYKFNI